ncbi:MAG: prephenate dehydratase [Chloroflexota bacterium]|nr:prephenate dehydratase [Chloroflexota bacterium]
MSNRGVRGAITVDHNTSEAILQETRRLLALMIQLNEIKPGDVASVIFTTTRDLTAEYPALAARQLGWLDAPLLCGHEMDVPGGLPRCVRVLIDWNTERAADEIVHVYLRGARNLRPDKATLPPVDMQSLESWIEDKVDTWRGQQSAKKETRMKVIAFQGEPGAYSEQAIRQHFGDTVVSLPCRSFEGIFAAVDSGEADFGALPVENSLAGSINRAYDLLLEHDLRVWGEILLPVRHNLMAPSGSTLDSITTVRSHPQALAQCERWLTQRGLQAVTWYDTAGSAKELAANPEAGVAAIASRLAAETYGLEILAEGIEDLSFNVTRFFLIGKGDPPVTGEAKTSLVFAVSHEPGSLYACMGEFATRGINLTKLESRPRRNRPWHYVFYLDFEGHWQDPACQQALVGLLSRAAFVKLLGSYPAATKIDENGDTGQSELLQI